jgi:hypothetical protein
MLFPFQRAPRARIAAHVAGSNRPESPIRAAPPCPDFLAQLERQAPDDIFRAADQRNGALYRLVVELGHAARAGWAPTIRWIALLLAVATAAAVLIAAWK